MSKKILFCTPFTRADCGIAMVGRHIIGYYKEHQDDIELDVMSLDRRTDIKPNMSVVYRIYRGIVEYLTTIGQLNKKIKTQKYDVAHITTSASFGLIPTWIMLKLAQKSHIRTIVHFHFGRIPAVFQKKNWEYKWILKVCNLSDKAIVIDQASYNTLLNENLSNVGYIPNPVAPRVLTMANEANEVRVKNHYLFVGHVWRAKGIYELIHAIKCFPEIRLKVVGAAADVELQALRELAGDSIDRIKFTGALPYDEVIKEMLCCDVFVLPTYSEGFPNVILESMACGCPIIASSVGAISQMLSPEESGISGLLIEPGSVDALISAIKTYQTDAELKVMAGNNARQRVNRLYSISIVWSEYKNIWNSITENCKK